MSGRESAGRGPGGGVGADVPRVPVSAGAWGADSAQALEVLATDELADLDEELLRKPEAWRAAGGAEGIETGPVESIADQAEGDRGADGAAGAGGLRGEQGSAVPAPEPPREPRAGGGIPASPTPPRRSGADPVKVLMHRHRDLCERAVDPLEIAAGLEAHGMTDRTAARFRHKDVFSLAEEMYARVPRDGDRDEPTTAAPAPAPTTGRRGAWAGLALLPGAACALTLPALDATTGATRAAVGIGGALAVAVALRTALRHGPLRAGDGPLAPATRLWVWWLLAYALLGDGLLTAALAGGPDAAWDPSTASLLALAVAVAPATWCARLYAAGARRRLAISRRLAEFASSVRPLLLASVALFALSLVTLLGLSGAALDQRVDYAGAGALGVLLLLARLLGVHGRTHAPAVVLGAAAAVEALAVASVFAARLPGCDALGAPVEAAVDALGAGVVPGAACGVAALALLVHATRTLTRASAHASADGATGGAP
ncbi:hypothetical protein [Streptomyces sp. cg35]|uniref:hypothetical protein n=1 Tax=Streptomyces sp. cg35 TaxID=3421650 RepID=UPI003D171583